jgi:hypothetical protein
MMKWSNPPDALERASETHVLHRGASLMAMAANAESFVSISTIDKAGWRAKRRIVISSLALPMAGIHKKVVHDSIDIPAKTSPTKG